MTQAGDLLRKFWWVIAPANLPDAQNFRNHCLSSRSDGATGGTPTAEAPIFSVVVPLRVAGGPACPAVPRLVRPARADRTRPSRCRAARQRDMGLVGLTCPADRRDSRIPTSSANQSPRVPYADRLPSAGPEGRLTEGRNPGAAPGCRGPCSGVPVSWFRRAPPATSMERRPWWTHSSGGAQIVTGPGGQPPGSLPARGRAKPGRGRETGDGTHSAARPRGRSGPRLPGALG